MRLLVRDIALVLAVASTMGCAGLISAEASASKQDGGIASGEPSASPTSDASVPDVSIPDVSIADAYGARFLGDADQCAAIVCSGAQVCCVVPIPSDAPTPHPNNKCDYDCTAQCMDSCPVISLGSTGGALAPEGNGSMHGGAVVLPADDAGLE
jgi:hypothetical protein